MSRIPELERHQLSPEQTKVYDAILASRGNLHGPFRVWLHSPELADRAQRLGEVARYETSLDPRLRELAILETARFWSAPLEWTLHEPTAREAGLSRSTIEAIKRRRAPEFEHPDEELIYLFTRELLRDHVVSDDVFSGAWNQLGTRGVTELTMLIGYYTLVALSLNAFEIQVPEGMPSRLPDTPGEHP